MNKNPVLPGVVIFMFVSLFFSCQNGAGKSGPRDYHMAVMDSISVAYNAQKEEWDRSIITVGNVNITVMDSMVYIEHDPENGDQEITYFLQTEKREGHVKPGLFGKAEVLFMDRNLIVNSLEKEKTYMFSIKVDPDPNYVKKIEDLKQYKGIGLGVRKVFKSSQTKNAPTCSCEIAGSQNVNCATGGSESLSCSSTNDDGSCRISCSGQRFACCGRRM
jgi:hypothetical protein